MFRTRAFLLHIRSAPAKHSCSVKFPNLDIIDSSIIEDLQAALAQLAESAADLKET